ncbi:MAG: ribbon-helix-helix protein, CopG family [Deltaproteobacteria bacterium]|nr:MAG: ribbon-helix-helix protein, CopG family [Deltaproteobacteria bacterium]
MCMHITVVAMRTTIEIPDDQRAKLMEIAARRGLKGFSRIVQEAIEKYLEDDQSREERIAEALSVLGSLSDDQADLLEESIRRLRENWR